MCDGTAQVYYVLQVALLPALAFVSERRAGRHSDAGDEADEVDGVANAEYLSVDFDFVAGLAAEDLQRQRQYQVYRRVANQCPAECQHDAAVADVAPDGGRPRYQDEVGAHDAADRAAGAESADVHQHGEQLTCKASHHVDGQHSLLADFPLQQAAEDEKSDHVANDVLKVSVHEERHDEARYDQSSLNDRAGEEAFEHVDGQRPDDAQCEVGGRVGGWVQPGLQKENSEIRQHQTQSQVRQILENAHCSPFR